MLETKPPKTVNHFSVKAALNIAAEVRWSARHLLHAEDKGALCLDWRPRSQPERLASPVEKEVLTYAK